MRDARARVWIALIAVLLAASAAAQSADDACRDCHGSLEQVKDAAEALDVTASAARLAALVVARQGEGSVHAGMSCLDCHPQAEEVPHPAEVGREQSCVNCHDDALMAVNASIHKDDSGGPDTKASCAACHTAHDVRPKSDPRSATAPINVAQRCLACHDKQEYLVGVHGFGVQMAGLDVAATCVSCHGDHDILPMSDPASKVARQNVSDTCGTCHGRVSEVYRTSVHGALLEADHDNPDVPTCDDCHNAHGTVDPRSPRFRVTSPEICGRCHRDEKMMAKYGLSTQVFETYVADFHGTTAELFRLTTPDQPLNQAVCFDCHGYHDVGKVKGVDENEVNARMLVRCQACHPGANFNYLSAWTSHYIPSPDRYPLIYYVQLFYRWVIPGTVGFFLLYIGIDMWGRRRHGRSA